jgi:mitochondrial fission protein ELM1
VAHSLTIWVLGDGKPGHENQSLGLAEALDRLCPCAIHQISLAEPSGFVARLRAASQAAATLPTPDLIVGAGHATHPALLWLARKTSAVSIVLMRPSLPLRWFDLCLAPEHDFPEPQPPANVITTRGALNRVRAAPNTPRHGGLILIGGPSATHDWDETALLAEVTEIVTAPGTGPWQLTNSRRTPDSLLPLVREAIPTLEVFPHESTTRDWLPDRLAAAAAVWVTEDSVSMVYEALSSGARVGLLPVPRKQSDTRVLRGLTSLIDEGFVTPFARWHQNHMLPAPPHPLREADRCAQMVLNRFFSDSD